jgi:putative transposase
MAITILAYGIVYGLSKYTIKTGCFTQDSRGRWYACLVVADYPKLKSVGTSSIGIDLGLKEVATCSDGYKIENKKFFYKHQEQLAKSQRANTKKKTRNIHAKIKNSRNDYLQKESTKLVQRHGFIVVGNLSAKALTKTKMAKSVYDSGFSMFKTMLRYKCQQAGVLYDEVSEKYTTQTCSCCGSRHSSPRGRAGLGIREWACQQCGTLHDRDINAALNILAVGHGRLVEGIRCL